MSEKCRKFLQNKNIDINNFIFISPDALSISALSNDFWNKLEIQLRNLGYYIYQNSKELSISESVYLASCAKSVIALRSGFTEGISSVVEKMFVIYRNLKDPYIPADQVIAAYTLKKYPYVNSENIYEYNAEELSEDLIINSIIENLTKGED